MLAKQDQDHPKSLITSIYRAWEHHHVPAIHYHYLLSILAGKAKDQQTSLMRRELDLLHRRRDHYHIISAYVEAREETLREIKLHLQALRFPSDWPSVSPEEGVSNEYEVVFRSQEQTAKPTSLEELIVHLVNYQRVTYEVIVSIRRWQQELVDLGYQGLVQFIFRHQDYLQKLENDTLSIQDEYSQFFQQNLFLIFRKDHELTDYGLVYQQLKLEPQFVAKIKEALQIVANHRSDCERHRLLGIQKQQSVKRTIRKTESLKGLYSQYRKGTLIVRDHSLLGDKPSFLQNKNILSSKQIIVNPEVSLQTRKFSGQISQKVAPINRGSVIFSSLDRESLSQQLRRNSYFGSKGGVTLKELKEIKGPNLSNLSTSIENPIKYQKSPINHRLDTQELQLSIEKDIPQNDIIHYLQGIFTNRKSAQQIETIAKAVLKEKTTLTLIRVQIEHLLVAWLGVTFISKGTTLRKSVDIKFLFKLMVLTNLEPKLIEEFKKLGYGVVLMQGQIVSDQKVPAEETRLLQVSFKVGEQDQNLLKKLVKENKSLKNSRVLKYYTYSKETKYHDVCQHRRNECRLSFWVEELRKVSIGGKQYLRARCDSICKRGNSWRVEHHLNSFVMTVGTSFDEVLESIMLTEIDFDSSFGDEKEEKKQFICLPEVKTIHRYVNEENRSILVQYLKTNSSIKEEVSIRQSSNDLKDVLIIQRPFVVAFTVTDDEGLAKPVAFLEFD